MSTTQQQPQQLRQPQFTDELAALLDLGEKLMWSLFFFVKEENKCTHRTIMVRGKEDQSVLERLETIIKFVVVHVSSFLTRFTSASPNGDRLYVDFMRLLNILRDIDVIITNNTQFFLDFMASFANEKDASQAPASATPKMPTATGSVPAIVIPPPAFPETRISSPSIPFPSGDQRNRKNTLSNRISMRFTGKPNQLMSSAAAAALLQGGGPPHNPLDDAKPITIKRTGRSPASATLSHDYGEFIEWFAFSECGCGPCMGYLKRVLQPQPPFWCEVVDYALRLLNTTESEIILFPRERDALVRGMAICFYFADVPCTPPVFSDMGGGMGGDMSYYSSLDGGSGSGVGVGVGGGVGGGAAVGIESFDISCSESTKQLFEKSLVWFKKIAFFPVCNGGYADCVPVMLLMGLPSLGKLVSMDIPEQAASIKKAAGAKGKDMTADDFASVETAVCSIGPKITNTQSVVSHVMKVFDGLGNLIACSNLLRWMLLSNSFSTDQSVFEKEEEISSTRKWDHLYDGNFTSTVLQLTTYIKGFQSSVVCLPRDISQNAMAMLFEELAVPIGRSGEFALRLQRAGIPFSPETFTVDVARAIVFTLIEDTAANQSSGGGGGGGGGADPYISELAIRHIKHLCGLMMFFDTFNDYANLASLWFIDPNPMPNPKAFSAPYIPGLTANWTSQVIPQAQQNAYPSWLVQQQQQQQMNAAHETVLGIGIAQKEIVGRISNYYGEFPILDWVAGRKESVAAKDELFDKCKYITHTYKVLAKDVLEGAFSSSQIVLIDYVYSDARLVYSQYCPRLCSALDAEYTQKPTGLCNELGRGIVDLGLRLLSNVMPKDTLENAVSFLLSCADVIPVTLSTLLQEVFDTVGRDGVIKNVTYVTSYKISMLAEHADKAVTDYEACDRTINFIHHQIAYNMVLDFIGAQERPVTLETPIAAFCKLGKINIAKRLLLIMFSAHIYADVVPIDDGASQNIVALVRGAVAESPVLVHVRDCTQNTLLHWAARLPLTPERTEELIQFLIESGSDLEARNSAGATPLLEVATPMAMFTLVRFGARLDAARLDGNGLAAIRSEWMDVLQQALGDTEIPPPEQVNVLNIMVVAPDVPFSTTAAPIVVGGGSGNNNNSSSSNSNSNSKGSGKDAGSEPEPHAQMPLQLRFLVMSTIILPHGLIFSLEKPVFPWLKPDAKKKFGEESWPLVAMGNVEGSMAGKNTLFRICVGSLADEKMLTSCMAQIVLYDVGNSESLDYELIRSSIPQSLATNKFFIGVGSEVRSDKAAIKKYWEQRALPVRLDDAIRVGRMLRVKGFGECQNTCIDVYNILYAAAHFIASRVYSKSSAMDLTASDGGGSGGGGGGSGNSSGGSNSEDLNSEKRVGNDRIKVLIPMQPSDSYYDTVKMLVLGHEEAGKTSLLDSISEKHSWKTFSKAIWKKRTAQTESTIGISRVPLTIGEVPVNAYDFGGQLEYHAIHEYFLSPYCAMYVVVVDGSKERLVEQLGYWLQLLHSHSKGPRGSCALIVVCTKADMIEKRSGADAVAAKKGFLKNYLSCWPSLRKIASTEVFMVSNKTGVGIKALRDALKERIRVLSKTRVQQINLNAAAAFAKTKAAFMNFDEFVQFMVDSKVLTKGNLPPEYTRQNARDILDFLHNSGRAVVSSGYDTICCRPELMSSVLSTFVAPENHKQRLLKANCQRADVFTHNELVRRFKLLDDVKYSSDPEGLCAKIISALEDMKFCYMLRPEEATLAYNIEVHVEQSYIFPSLCPSVDFVALPYNEAADRGPEILRVTCHGYECPACRYRCPAGARVEPPEGGYCPKCGCPEIVHVCLNEAPGPRPAFIGSHHQETYAEYLAVIQKASSNCMWTCLMNDANGTSQTVSFPRTCPCVMPVAPVVKYVACIVSSMLEQGISMSQFNRVAVQLRRYMHPRYRLFRNFVVFRDMYGNVILATTFMKDRQCSLGIISRGAVPHLWVEALHPLLSLGEAVVPACPACAHANTFTPLQPAPTEGPNAIPGAAEAGIMVCENGHVVSSDQVNMGMQRNEAYCTENALWGPKKAAAFYKESAAKWLTDPRYPNATFTELTDAESTPARQAEYIFARSLFYKFVGTDPASSKFSLTKVVYVENKASEALFTDKFSEFAARAYSSSSFVRAAPQRRRFGADKSEWQQWVLTHLASCLERVCGNEKVNLVGGWHGTIDKSAHGIANTNFYMPAENKASKDPGYFGRGVYFTQSPAYGVDYAVFSANITKQHAQGGEIPYMAEELTPCLVFSWILLGRVYPVTEAAEVGSETSLMGKGCVPGYDSHYVVLPQQPRGAKHAAITKPYNPSSLLDKPGCDEIVVFNKAQILPRYIFYYENNERVSNVKDGFLPLEVRDAKTVVLWVDDEIGSHEMVIVQTYIKKAVPNVAIVTMVSSSELKLWLHQFGQEVEDKILVITNFFRANDGETNAAWRVVNEVRKVAKLKKVPILVLKKKPTDQIEYFSKMKLVYTAESDANLVLFIQQKKL